MIKLQYCFQVLLLEVLLLQLHDDLVALFEFMESLNEDFQVLRHLLSRLGLNFARNAIQVCKVPFSEGLEELFVVGQAPIVEASLNLRLVLLLQLVGYDLKVVNFLLDLDAKRLQGLQTVEELEFVSLLQFDCLVFLRNISPISIS